MNMIQVGGVTLNTDFLFIEINCHLEDGYFLFAVGMGTIQSIYYSVIKF